MTAAVYAPPVSDLRLPMDTSHEAAPFLSPRGRIGRLQLLSYQCAIGLAQFAVMPVLGLATQTIGTTAVGVGSMLAMVLATALSIIFTIKRCHDFNAPGWWAIAAIVPLVNLVFWFIPGTKGSNSYGNATPVNRWYHWVGGLLLPAIGVLGVLAAVAIPAYQDYVARAAGM